VSSVGYSAVVSEFSNTFHGQYYTVLRLLEYKVFETMIAGSITMMKPTQSELNPEDEDNKLNTITQNINENKSDDYVGDCLGQQETTLPSSSLSSTSSYIRMKAVTLQMWLWL